MIYIQERVTNSYTTRDIYNGIKKSLNVDEHTFGQIIKTVNGLLAERVINGLEVNLPSKMGKLELRKFKTKVKLKDGKIVTNKPIDWRETLNLWEEDEEAKKNKTLVRHDTDFVYRIVYKVDSANYKNKSFYKLSLSRRYKRTITKNIKKGIVDAVEMK